jgi:hypothetical protein
MLDLSRSFPRSGPDRRVGGWIVCAALVFAAGIACSDGADFVDTGGGIDVGGTWSIAQSDNGGCSPVFTRTSMGIDQDGDQLVLMFNPNGFARAELVGSAVDIDYAFDNESLLSGTLVLSEDGNTLTGSVTLEVLGDCTQIEGWVATRTSFELPPANADFDGSWPVAADFDMTCVSGASATSLDISQSGASATIDPGLVGSPVSGLVTGDFLRARWQDSDTSFDAVFELISGLTPGLAGDVSFAKSGGSPCQGSDFYAPGPTP